MKLRIILFWPCVRSLFIGWQHGMARPLPVFGFCQPSAKCLRMICEKKPSVVGAGLREELACQKCPRAQRVSWSNEGSYEEQLRTPYHPTAEFTRLITAAQREIYTECRPKLITLVLFHIYIWINYILSIVYLWKAECSWFDAEIFGHKFSALGMVDCCRGQVFSLLYAKTTTKRQRIP